MRDDARWLRAAAALTERARPLSRPNPAVAALIVADGELVGRGWTASGGRPHAEAVALKQAGDAARGATIYVTLEPCAHESARGPTCADLMAQSGLARAVIGVGDPDPRTDGAGIERLRAAGIGVELASDAACRDSLAGFLARESLGRPHVTLKLAVSADGFIGPLSGEPVVITGEIARAHVHRERARNDAILVGGATLRSDAPRLDVRLLGLENRGPRRYVLTTGEVPEGWNRLQQPQAIHDLGETQYLYVEGGGQTAAAFLKAGLVDKLMLYRAPISLGEGIPAFGSLGPAPAQGALPGWTRIDRRALGRDMLEIYAPPESAQASGEN